MVASPFLINPHIFRDYDIRGLVGRDLSEDFARLLGRSFARLLGQRGGREVVIGYDCRRSSAGYAQAVIDGLRAEGMDCLLLGMCPTPQLYWSLHHGHYAGGIQITGSHNAPDMNGFKLCIGRHTFSGGRIQQLREVMMSLQPQAAAAGPRGMLREEANHAEYIADLVRISRERMGTRRLKVVVDAGNGVAGLTGPRILRGLGIEVIELHCDPNGAFPNHHPDPVIPDHLRELSERVRTEHADFGVGWDGDGDRIGTVDEQGRIIHADLLLLLYARAVLPEQPGAMIIGDVKCSSRLFSDVERLGGRALMWKSGHAPLKEKLRETGAALGGELAGHIFFNHRFYGFDDAAHCACRLAEIVSGSSAPLSALLADLPPTVATPEIRVRCADEQKFRVVDRFKEACADFPVIDVDGVRVTFPHGWGLVRASNTEPALVLRFEADSHARLEEYERLLRERLVRAQSACTE